MFYDKKIKIQLRILTKSKIHYNDNVTQQAWDLSKLSSRKCYLAKISPGSNSEIATDGLIQDLQRRDPTKKESEKGYINFSVIINQIKSIEWLYLSSFGHRRLLINIENGRNTYNWLIP